MADATCLDSASGYSFSLLTYLLTLPVYLQGFPRVSDSGHTTLNIHPASSPLYLLHMEKFPDPCSLQGRHTSDESVTLYPVLLERQWERFGTKWVESRLGH